MENLDEEQKLVRQYLLGDLDEEQQQAIEEHLTIDRHFLEEILAIESELFDDYVNDDLSESDQKKFVEHLLSTSVQRQKLHFAKALTEHGGVEAAANSPPLIVFQSGRKWRPVSKELIFGIAALACIVAALFIVYKINIQHSHTSLQQELADLNREERQRSEDSSDTLIVGPLTPWLVRESGEMRKISIPDTTEIVQLRLSVTMDPYQNYQAVLETAEGQDIFTIGKLKRRDVKGEFVVLLNMPARILSPGDYQLELNGLNEDEQLEGVGRYTFRVLENNSPNK